MHGAANAAIKLVCKTAIPHIVTSISAQAGSEAGTALSHGMLLIVIVIEGGRHAGLLKAFRVLACKFVSPKESGS